MKPPRIRRQGDIFYLYTDLRDPKKILQGILTLVEVTGLSILLLFGLFALSKDSAITVQYIFIAAFLVFAIWLFANKLRSVYHQCIRLFSPILIIHNNIVKVLDRTSKYQRYNLEQVNNICGNIYSIKRSYSLTLGNPKHILFAKISLCLNGEENITFELINTPLFSDNNPKYLTKELKNKSAIVGRLIAEELGVTYFWKNQIIHLEKND